MAYHALTDNFRSFFGELNPTLTTERAAASEYAAVKALIEDRAGLAVALAPTCFLQGSYRQQTAIHTLHDVDVVALCELWQPGSAAGGGGVTWDRHQIFDTVAAPLLASSRFRDRVRYSQTSMCIKIDGPMRVEILPVVYRAGNNDSASEPFRLHRPETQQWEDGYARFHQQWLTWKNDASKTDGNFIPMIKVLKHLRSHHGVSGVSFHLECVLFALPDSAFAGTPPDYITRVLASIAGHTAAAWHATTIRTPCKDRAIFSTTEWAYGSWAHFHQFISECSKYATLAATTTDRQTAIACWQQLFGDTFFPHL